MNAYGNWMAERERNPRSSLNLALADLHYLQATGRGDWFNGRLDKGADLCKVNNLRKKAMKQDGLLPLLDSRFGMYDG